MNTREIIASILIYIGNISHTLGKKISGFPNLVVRLSEDKSYMLFAYCSEDRESGFVIMSIRLDQETRNVIHGLLK